METAPAWQPPTEPTERDIVEVTGTDATAYLQTQLSQDLRPMTDGEERWTFVLQPQGKIDALARIRRYSQERYELDTDPGFGEILAARLNRFKIRVDVAITLHPAAAPAEDDPARLEARWPKMGAEIIPGETLPAETGIIDAAVSFTKGCYPGQELVERMDSRGARARSRLEVVDVPDGALPGDDYVVAGETVGTLTSVIGRRALARVTRQAHRPD